MKPIPSTGTSPYLVVLRGPVSHTYRCIHLDPSEVALMEHLVREFAPGLDDEHAPWIQVRPLEQASAMERTRVAFAERARLAHTTTLHDPAVSARS